MSALCQLDDLLTFIEADAKEVPFGNDVVFHACSFCVGINLPEKLAVLRECARFARPGGRLIWTEVTQDAGDPYYPLPWSTTPDGSHIETREALIKQFGKAGFAILSVEDETGAHLELVRQIKQSGRVPELPQVQLNAAVLGPDFPERRQITSRVLEMR
ncbi:methyltransferase domain-containing protein [Roseovarius sp. Pro17]|uniref:methyltransferase domain-containing protein n=1 Tax=Roseovarius sp. Pro17 TaxID=3108175 RepID=UPI002D7956E9|nr:methyltransferase domain-containing protein [Roseovarius sp. Pro17]